MAGKKKARKSAARKSGLTITPKVEIDFAVDSQKMKEIQACLKRGRLQIVMTKVDFDKGGRFAGAYAYD